MPDGAYDFDFSVGRGSRNGCAAEDHPHFLESATKLAAALRHTIFVDQVCAFAEFLVEVGLTIY